MNKNSIHSSLISEINLKNDIKEAIDLFPEHIQTLFIPFVNDIQSNRPSEFADKTFNKFNEVFHSESNDRIQNIKYALLANAFKIYKEYTLYEKPMCELFKEKFGAHFTQLTLLCREKRKLEEKKPSKKANKQIENINTQIDRAEYSCMFYLNHFADIINPQNQKNNQQQK